MMAQRELFQAIHNVGIRNDFCVFGVYDGAKRTISSNSQLDFHALEVHVGVYDGAKRTISSNSQRQPRDKT